MGDSVIPGQGTLEKWEGPGAVSPMELPLKVARNEDLNGSFDFTKAVK
mgnify:CR=1 FL=1